MNCKPGDLAFYVGREIPAAYGQVVTVVCRDGDCWPKGPAWHVDPPLRSAKRNPELVYDYALRPIRPGDISDEEVRELYAPKVPEAA